MTLKIIYKASPQNPTNLEVLSATVFADKVCINFLKGSELSIPLEKISEIIADDKVIFKQQKFRVMLSFVTTSAKVVLFKKYLRDNKYFLKTQALETKKGTELTITVPESECKKVENIIKRFFPQMAIVVTEYKGGLHENNYLQQCWKL